MSSQNNFTAEAAMLIRKPIEEVFEAFINPEITTHFWFTKSTGKLEEGKEIIWTWEMYNHSTALTVKSIVPNETILIEWANSKEKASVEWNFKSLGNSKTFVSVLNSGFKGNTEEIVTEVRNSTEGFTLVLAGLKAYLEHGIELNLVGDRFPQGL